MLSRYTPKLLFFIFLVGLVISGLLIRLVDLQLVQGESFLARADSNRFFTQRLQPERGVFLDRYDQPLVINTPEYFKIINTKTLYSQNEALSPEDALKLMATDSASVSYQLRRKYLYPKSTAHVLGYVGAVTRDDLVADKSLNVADSVGKMGLEKVFDEQIRGQAGEVLFEIDALGNRRRKIGEKPQIPGDTLSTTIDPYLSEVALEALGNQRGSVVILDAESGAVLSLVSSPGFDANLMSAKYLDAEAERERLNKVREMINHPLQLFFNRAVGGTYPPGSVFKLITAIAGLDSEAITPQTEVVDEGALEVGEYSYANWYYTQYGGVEGAIALERAIARSNDIYFYKTAEWTGPTKIAQMARMFGLGSKTGIELPGEALGLVPDPAWKEKELGESWYLGNSYHFGIGQDNLLTSPLQIAVMTQAFANHGTQCSPSLINSPEMECRELGIREEHLEQVLKGMLTACSSGGTAFPFFEHNSQYRSSDLSASEEISRGSVACKTGTAEFGGVDERGYKKTHGWFIAILGLDKKRVLPQSELSDSQVTEASASGQTDLSLETQSATSSSKLRERWLGGVKKAGFPDRIVITVMVESDEAQPYKEGSREAAPVAKSIVDWIYGQE